MLPVATTFAKPVNTRVRACSVMDESVLCIGCGKTTKAGDRRFAFGLPTNAIKNLYEYILTSCCEIDIETISESEKYMCRSCYGKYERFLTQYRTLTNGVERFLSISRKKEVDISSQVAATACPVKRKATTNDDSRPVKKTHFCKLNDETVSPGVSVCSLLI